MSDLPYVKDPDKVMADITKGDYEDYIRDFRGYETALISKAQRDTSLVDYAKRDSIEASKLMEGVAKRNADRYGVALTPAQQQEQAKALQRANTLGAAQSINNARIAQKEQNQSLLADLINIGQGVNRSSLNQLGASAQNAVNRENQYQQAKAQHKAQTYQTIGTLGALAILAF